MTFGISHIEDEVAEGLARGRSAKALTLSYKALVDWAEAEKAWRTPVIAFTFVVGSRCPC